MRQFMRNLVGQLAKNFLKVLIAMTLGYGVSMASTKADPGDAWPWGAELPFPWKGIQGTWGVYLNGEWTYFSFRTVRSSDGLNQLDVVQYDSETCEVIAYGGGFEEERVVRGIILTNGGAKNITIHVFSEAALKYGQDQAAYDHRARKSKTYTVMSMSGFWDEETESLELKKLHNSPTGICGEKKRH